MHGPAVVEAGTPTPIDVNRCPYITIYFVGTDVLSSGVVTIEEAPEQDHAGAWAAVGSPINASDASAGATKAVHLTVGAYAWIRLRLSTPLGGGGTLAAIVEAIPVPG